MHMKKIAPKNYRFICTNERMSERPLSSVPGPYSTVVEFLMMQMCNCVVGDHARTYFMRLLSRFHELPLSMFI